MYNVYWPHFQQQVFFIVYEDHTVQDEEMLEQRMVQLLSTRLPPTRLPPPPTSLLMTTDERDTITNEVTHLINCNIKI